jgi:3,4-dihydroxy 2-butanone 4-phosphate synthase/GTP cyclohydrolase II
MNHPEASQKKAVERVLRAIEVIKAGGMVIMVDDEDRENEGDLVFAAEDCTPAKVNFMAKEARGLICLPMAAEFIERLKLPQMGDHSKFHSQLATAFTVSIEAKNGVTTGISASDRSHTILTAIADHTTPEDILVPGHIFPLKARSGGVLERAGHTEGSVDLSRLSGKKEAAVICEIINDDGTMARRTDLEGFAKKHGLEIVSIEDLITFRLMHDSLVEEVAREQVETNHGSFQGVWFQNKQDQHLHFALLKGNNFSEQITQVRVHRKRPIADVFLEQGPLGKIEAGLRMLKESEAGVLVYLCGSSAGSLIHEELNETLNPGSKSASDPRMYGIGAQILRTLGVKKMCLHSSGKKQILGLGAFGLEIVDSKDLLDGKPQGPG